MCNRQACCTIHIGTASKKKWADEILTALLGSPASLSIQSKAFHLEIALRAGCAAAKHGLSPKSSDTVDVILALVDHYEPQVGKPPREKAQERVEDWLARYPQVAERHRDWDGRPPAHSFFYPWDEYDEWELSRISELCRYGFGEIEVHLHHRDDTAETLRAKFRDAIAAFRSHGALSSWADSRPAFGFIHGNWALDNSRVENGRNFCGVNNEITILLQEGCYADFTFPAWQHIAQPRTLNSLYYAVDDPAKPKSHDRGIRVAAGHPPVSDGLLMVQGPLAPFVSRAGGLPRPAMDDSDMASYRRYHPARLDRWVRAGICVQGRPDRVFVKLHCHGAADANREALLGTDLEAMFADAESRYNDGKRYRLHYVSAREMFNIIKATEAGFRGDVESSRDWVLPPPAASGSAPAHDHHAARSI